jgi:L-threonylcarbamoyladenylate synthase
MAETDFYEDIRNALKTLKDGGVILYPTDTVWGLGCDASNTGAVEKIFRIKARSDNKSLIILVNGEAMLERYVKDIPAVALNLIEVSDTPLTIIYPAAKNLAAGIPAEDGSVGIRITDDEFCSTLIERFRRPIVSTSANVSGEPAPSHFGEVSDIIIKAVDYVVMHRREDRQKHVASPVIKVEPGGVIKIIRK